LIHFGGELPRHTAGQGHYILGGDLGYTDPARFSLRAYHDHAKTLYVPETEKFVHLDVTDVAQIAAPPACRDRRRDR
jgi:hypothetical protein